MKRRRSQEPLMKKLAALIVERKTLIFLLYIFALLFCLLSMGWVEVENDVTAYLPTESETRQGIEVMNGNFEAFATARVMVSNVTYETALVIYDQISAIPGISLVVFDQTEAHYKDTAALFDVNFTGSTTDESTLTALEQLHTLLSGYDVHIDTTVGTDMNSMLQSEMTTILIVGVVIIIVVLTLTSRSYAEVPVLLLTFAAAALLNMGTNFILGKISFISNSIAVVLQLALAIDYAIILCHRFSDENENKPPKEACIDTLTKAIPEIGASSLTTVSGLAALGFMQFGIGLDMALVLIKAILFSLLSVFTLMPGLLILFSKPIEKTRHKKLIPNVTFLGKFAVKTRRVLPFVFLAVLIGACILSSQCPYCYGFNDLKTAKMTDQQHAYFEIKETFGTSNMVAIIVPTGDYEAEAAVLKELETRPEVAGTMGLAGIKAMDGYMLTDALTPRQLSELIGLDYEVVEMIYAAYAAEHNQYGHIIGGLDEYKVPLFDMFLFLKDQLDVYNISLDSAGGQELGAVLGQLETARKQLRTDSYSRMVVYLNLPEESDETFAFLGEIRRILGQHYEGDYYVLGNSTSARDLSDSFVSDNLLISILSALFVILVLLFTFHSVGLPVLLIVVIQGSIWINFSFPVITGTPLYFLGYLIVNAIQMGANIDYAIVISSHYQELKQTMPHKEAIVHALNASFATVFTSGTILASAGLLIGNMSAQPVVSIMGNCIGRGTIISVILVLFVLPSILVLGDSIIERTRFKMPTPTLPTANASGTMRVRGHVRGYICGMVDADFEGILKGELNATVSNDTVVEEEEEGGEENG